MNWSITISNIILYLWGQISTLLIPPPSSSCVKIKYTLSLQLYPPCIALWLTRRWGLYDGTRPWSSSPLIVSRDSFSPLTWARFQTGGAQPTLADVFIYFWYTVSITLHVCVIIFRASPLYLAVGLPGHLVSPLVCRGPWMSTVVFYC